jgi:hypothetical protein
MTKAMSAAHANPISTRHRSLFLALMVLALAAHLEAHGQEVRDPTRAPPGASAQAPDAAKPDAASPFLEGTAIVLRDDKTYLASGTRLYTVGQQIGIYKIERITETEVWLRNGSQVQKIQRFEGIQRRAVQP